jgi:hypothetical protein
MCTSCLYNEKEKVVDEEFCNSQTEIEQPFHLFANSRQIIPVQPENNNIIIGKNEFGGWIPICCL